MSVTLEQLEALSWVGSVQKFVEDSPWLTDRHLPQLKALISIAKRLDGGGKEQAALISQFTLTQRTLMGKAPEVAGGDPSMPPALPGLDGNTWGPETPNAGDYGSA